MKDYPRQQEDLGQVASDYLINVLKSETLPNILDVGANPVNEPPYLAMLQSGHCNIYGFEPHPGAFAELMENRGEHEFYFNDAVGDGKEHTLQITKPSGFTSLLNLSKKGFDYLGHHQGALDGIEEEPMGTVRLDDVEGLPRIDVVKIDIQGGENMVFENGHDALKDAVAIITEVRHSQLYEDEAMFGGLDRELRGQGFIFHKFLANKRVVLGNSQFKRLNVGPNRNQYIDGDAAYICNLLDPASISTDRIKLLAIVAHDLLRSYDLVTRCLDILVEREVVDADVPEKYVDALPAHHRREA